MILTHHDVDHIGSLVNIVEELPDTLRVFSHIEEKPYIQGDEIPLKISKFEAQMALLTPEMKLMHERLKAGFASSKAKVNVTLTDGEELPYCGGITVIHTLGIHWAISVCIISKARR